MARLGRAFPPQTQILVAPAGASTQTFSYTASGGLTFSGAPAVVRVRTAAAAGGVSFAGTSAQARVASRTASGGIVFGGAATVAFHEAARIVAAAGGIVFGGFATLSFVLTGAVANFVWFARRKRRR